MTDTTSNFCVQCGTAIWPGYTHVCTNAPRSITNAEVADTNRAEPIPPRVYWAPLADNFYDADGHGQGHEFYRKWKPRCAEFPQGESWGWGKGSAHNPFKAEPMKGLAEWLHKASDVDTLHITSGEFRDELRRWAAEVEASRLPLADIHSCSPFCERPECAKERAGAAPSDERMNCGECQNLPYGCPVGSCLLGRASPAPSDAAVQQPIGQIMQGNATPTHVLWFNGFPPAGTKLYTSPLPTAPAGSRELEEMRERKDAAYLERNQVVAALAKCFPSGVARTAIEGWSEDWHGCVYIDLPTGQVSWHFHDSQAYLFDGLPPYAGSWDGHDTPEKYRRLAALAAAPLERIARRLTDGEILEALVPTGLFKQEKVTLTYESVPYSIDKLTQIGQSITTAIQHKFAEVNEITLAQKPAELAAMKEHPQP